VFFTIRDKSEGSLITVQTAAGVEVAGAWYRLLQGTGEVCALMLSEKSKRENDKDESSDVGHRCGRIRSSEEVAVMAVERRDSVIYTS
jgi:uncharacterized protein YigA (DUF484 family)